MSDPLWQLISGNAYKIFMAETERHLQSARSTFLEAKLPPSQDAVKEAGIHFHTLKGGAGFFGFQEMADTASALEKLLLKSSISVTDNLSQVKDLIHKIEELAKDLPPPGTKTD